MGDKIKRYLKYACTKDKIKWFLKNAGTACFLIYMLIALIIYIKNKNSKDDQTTKANSKLENSLGYNYLELSN